MAASMDKPSGEMVKKQGTTPGNNKDGLANKFANDGSFMEMFKQRMNEQTMKTAAKESSRSPAGGSQSLPSVTTTALTYSTEVETTSSSADSSVSGAASSSTTPLHSTTTSHPTKGTIPDHAVSKPKEQKLLPFVGKRRGAAPILKTGAVKKQKQSEDSAPEKTDAWSQYLAEVKKYKEQSCQEENKTRPLVK